MSIDDDLGLSRHLVAEDGLRFFRTNKVTILFGREGDGVYRKICHLTFNKKSGAIYAQFTYFRTGPGLVGLVTTVVESDGSSSVSWKDGGKVATHLVKYSHPPNGRAHFSQTGKHTTQFWSDSLNLRSDDGHLFEIHAFHLEPFETLQKTEVADGKRLFLPFQTAGQPEGVSLAAEWRTLAEVGRTAMPIGDAVGPVALVPRRDGKLFKSAFISPADDSPLRDHVLLLNVHPLHPPGTVTTPMLFFMRGWRKQDSFVAGSTASFLSFWYPVDNPEQVARPLGVSDFIRPDGR